MERQTEEEEEEEGIRKRRAEKVGRESKEGEIVERERERGGKGENK